MKKAIFAVVASLFLAGAAMAGSPTVVKDATGVEAVGTGPVVAVWKNTTSGNKVVVDFGTSSKEMADNASWSVHAKIVAGMGVAVADPASTFGLVVDASKSNSQQCSGGTTSRIGFPNRGQPIEANSCGLATAVIAAGQ